MAALPDFLAKVTREQAHRMVEEGLLTGRYELIEGELINKMGQSAPHSQSVRLVNAMLSDIFGSGRVQVQGPMKVALGDQQSSEPEPTLPF